MRDKLIIALLAFSAGLLLAFLLCSALAPEPVTCDFDTWRTAGFGGDGWYLTAEQIEKCALSDAPAWSDAWCEDCARVIDRLLKGAE